MDITNAKMKDGKPRTRKLRSTGDLVTVHAQNTASMILIMADKLLSANWDALMKADNA